MSYNTGPKLITSGLVLYLDAANPKSYGGTGATMYDLSGNNNSGSLINTPTFTSSYCGGLVYNGTNNYTITSTLNLSGPYTIITVAKSAVSTWNDYGFLCSRRVNSGFVMHPQQSTNDVTCYFTDNTGASLYGGNLTPSNITINHMYCMSSNGSNNHVGYLDGIKVFTNTNSITTGASSGQVYISKDSGNARYGNVTIYLTMIYNRQLTDVEYYQIYNATKTRFGI